MGLVWEPFEWQKGKDPVSALAIEDEFVDMGKNVFKGLDVDSLADNFLGLIVFLQCRQESIRFALRSIESRLRITFGLIDELRRFTFGFGLISLR